MTFQGAGKSQLEEVAFDDFHAGSVLLTASIAAIASFGLGTMRIRLHPPWRARVRYHASDRGSGAAICLLDSPALTPSHLPLTHSLSPALAWGLHVEPRPRVLPRPDRPRRGR